MTKPDYILRLKQIRDKYGLSQPQMDQKLGLSKGKINKLENSQQKLTPELAQHIGNIFNEDWVWLLTGETLIKQLEQAIPIVNEWETSCVPITFYNIGASAGMGNWLLDEDVIKDKLFFDRVYIKNILKAKPEHLHVIFADGDSMSPTINDKDLLIIDISKTEITNSGVYVFKVNNELKVKRLSKKLNGDLEVMSDNPKYSPEFVPVNSNIEIEIIGKVIRNECKENL
jgi:phage repressor protein C with HTH and peptisase S24 domain